MSRPPLQHNAQIGYLLPHPVTVSLLFLPPPPPHLFSVPATRHPVHNLLMEYSIKCRFHLYILYFLHKTVSNNIVQPFPENLCGLMYLPVSIGMIHRCLLCQHNYVVSAEQSDWSEKTPLITLPRISTSRPFN